MYHEKKKARSQAAKAIRVIIQAARELTAAEQVLLEENASSKKTGVKGNSNAG